MQGILRRGFSMERFSGTLSRAGRFMVCIVFPLILAKKLHPDTNKDDADAERKFQEVQRAYEVIYCRTVGPDAFEQVAAGDGPSSNGPFGGAGYGNPFEDIFGGAGGFNDVRGAGVPPGTKPETCSACRGSGMVYWVMSSTISPISCMLAVEGSPFSFSLEPMQVMQRTESCERCEVSQAGCDTWNLTQRQQILIEEFAKEEQQELEKGSTAAGASG
ncbi:hypothetical protein B296_00044746 [Ensete ventricosum]|uniref:J domain-containing protein n=1 Tax=Ensete ventricosum TaxID=4639 RepID=A0A426Z9Z2_ENSVE|nr:hypothetical protein B296_00044746 [Ensete ventricosum]